MIDIAMTFLVAMTNFWLKSLKSTKCQIIFQGFEAILWNMWNWAKVKCEVFSLSRPFLFWTLPHPLTSIAEMLDALLGLYKNMQCRPKHNDLFHRRVFPVKSKTVASQNIFQEPFLQWLIATLRCPQIYYAAELSTAPTSINVAVRDLGKLLEVYQLMQSWLESTMGGGNTGDTGGMP